MISNLKWFWVAITNESLPVGQRAQGAMIVEASSEDHARRRVEYDFIYDAETLHIGEVDAKYGNPPLAAAYTRLSNEEATRLATDWMGGVASPDDIKAAMSDDSARPGEPLFPGRSR